MRIAFIKKRYCFYGGAERYLESIINALMSKFEIHILSNNWYKSKNFTVHHIHTNKMFSDLSFGLNVYKFLKTHHFDVSISFDRTFGQDIYYASDGCRRRWLEQRRYISNLIRRLDYKFNPHNLSILFLEKKAVKESKLIITPSNMVKKDFLEFYGNEISKKCIVCYNGVDLNKFHKISFKQKLNLRQSLGIKDKKILLFVGSGSLERKGLFFAINVLKYLPKEFLLLVVSKVKKSFVNLAKELGLEKRVLFLGLQKDVERFFQVSDVFILPSLYDTFCNACLEAMACGLPIIITDTTGISEIIEDGKEGFILKHPINYEEFHFFIEESFKNWGEMSQYAYKKAIDFSLKKVTDNFLKIIESVVNFP